MSYISSLKQRVLDKSEKFWWILEQSVTYISLKPKVNDSGEPYSLYKTTDFKNSRKTSYLQISYFVENDFEERFNGKQIANFESVIERKYKRAENEFLPLVLKNALFIRFIRLHLIKKTLTQESPIVFIKLIIN
jgi:hypothetical protein